MRESQTAGQKFLHLLVALIMVTAGLLGVSTVTATVANAIGIGGDPGGGGGNAGGGGFDCGGCTSGGWNGGGGGGWSSPFPGVAVWSVAQRTATTAAARGIPSPIGTYRDLTLTSNGANVGQWLDQQYVQQKAPCQAPALYSIDPATGKTVRSPKGPYPSNAIGVRWLQTKNWNSDSSQLIESNVSFTGCLTPAAPIAVQRKCPVKVRSVEWRGPYGKLVNTTDPKGQPDIVSYASQPVNIIPDKNGAPNVEKTGVRLGTTTGWVYQTGKSPRDNIFARLWTDHGWTNKNVINGDRAWKFINSCASVYADFNFNPSEQPSGSASATPSRSFGKDPIGLVGNYSYKAVYDYVVCTKVSDGAYTAEVSTSNNTTVPRAYPAVTRYPAGSLWGCPNKYDNVVTAGKTSGIQQMGMCVTSDPVKAPEYQQGKMLTPVTGVITSKGNPSGYPNDKALSGAQANYNYNAGWWGITGNSCPTPTPTCTPGTGDLRCPPTTPTPTPSGTGTSTTTGFCSYPGATTPTITNDGKPIGDNSQITAQGQKVKISWGAVPQFSSGAVNVRNIQMSFSVEDNGAYPDLDSGLNPNDPIKSSRPLDGGEVPNAVPAAIDLQFFKGAALNQSGINAQNPIPTPFQVNMTRTFTYDTTKTTYTYRYINGHLTLVTSTTVSQPTTGTCPPLKATLTVLDTRVANNGG